MKRVVKTRLLQGKYKMTEVSALYCELIYNRQGKRSTYLFCNIGAKRVEKRYYPLSNLFQLQHIRFAASSVNTGF